MWFERKWCSISILKRLLTNKTLHRKSYVKNSCVLSRDRKLEDEVRKNGFEKCLTTTDGKNIGTIVEKMLRHRRHRGLERKLCYDEMLSGQ